MFASRVAQAGRLGLDISAAYVAVRKRCGDCPMDRMPRQAKSYRNIGYFRRDRFVGMSRFPGISFPTL
jgi:hypothetical protein